MTTDELLTIATFSRDIGGALLMGLAIGIERQLHQHPAGVRTNALVSVGAALFVSLSYLMPRKSSAASGSWAAV